VNLKEDILQASNRLAEQLNANQASVTTVESCTGGLVSAAITACSGSSAYFPGGVVTYSNPLKHEFVGVSNDTLERYGAVSPQTAIEMARGGQALIGSDYAISITGIAGPSGGSDDKPVGTVWICVSGPRNLTDCRGFRFSGDRDQIRSQSCMNALEMAIQMIAGLPAALPDEHERFDA